jgi:hypothetical protein
MLRWLPPSPFYADAIRFYGIGYAKSLEIGEKCLYVVAERYPPNFRNTSGDGGEQKCAKGNTFRRGEGNSTHKLLF